MMLLIVLPEGDGPGVCVVADGTYRLPSLPPGRYRVCAIRGSDERLLRLETPREPAVHDLVID